MITLPRATRCDNWARGCPGGPTDFGQELTPDLTPASLAFILGQHAGAMNHERRQFQAAAREAIRATQPAQSGRGSGRVAAGSQGGRFSALGTAPAFPGHGPPRRVSWGTAEYAPDGRPMRGPPGGRGGAGRRPAHVLSN